MGSSSSERLLSYRQPRDLGITHSVGDCFANASTLRWRLKLRRTQGQEHGVMRWNGSNISRKSPATLTNSQSWPIVTEHSERCGQSENFGTNYEQLALKQK